MYNMFSKEKCKHESSSVIRQRVKKGRVEHDLVSSALLSVDVQSKLH